MTECEKEFRELLSRIVPADAKAMEQAKRRWNSVAKPIGSLGVLEDDIIKIAGIRGDFKTLGLEKSALAVMCADHGVVAEGVTQTGKKVTRIVAENFTKDATSVTAMCHISGTDVFPVDMGMDCETIGQNEVRPFTLLDRKIARGSRNLAREAAMSREECVKALLAGIRMAGDIKAMGYGIVASGEMGIGNTTPSSTLTCVFTGLSPKEATGRGAGLSDEGLLKKQAAVERAVERFYAAYPEYAAFRGGKRQNTMEFALTALSELGGFDIAGIAGLFLGGAVYRIPVLIDGYISSVAALLASLLSEHVRDYMLASHVSREPAGKAVLDALGLFAPLDLGMHLGEGSGAVAMIPLLKMGASVYENMSTFEEISVETYVDYEAGEEGR